LAAAGGNGLAQWNRGLPAAGFATINGVAHLEPPVLGVADALSMILLYPNGEWKGYQAALVLFQFSPEDGLTEIIRDTILAAKAL
jgi:hypothetical protein